MRDIAQLVRQKSKAMAGDDAPSIRTKRKLTLDPTEMAKAAYERFKGTHKDADDFLSDDGPASDSDEYINTTGLEDDGRLDVEGDEDKRKSMLMRAVAKSRAK